METKGEGEAQPQFPMGKKRGGWVVAIGADETMAATGRVQIIWGNWGERRSWERGWLEQRGGRFLYTGGHDGGGVYKTAYRETIPERAKLTTRGNSQVLALHSVNCSATDIQQQMLT